MIDRELVLVFVQKFEKRDRNVWTNLYSQNCDEEGCHALGLNEVDFLRHCTKKPCSTHLNNHDYTVASGRSSENLENV